MVTYKILILLSLIIIYLFIQFIYFPRINNKIYLGGKKIISKLRKVKEKDQTFNSIKKYYINLDRSIGRKESIEEEFRLYGIINYERVSACDGKNMEKKKEGKFGDTKYKAPNDTKSSMRELATTCSHIKAIKRAYDNGDELAIIMEDDNKFTLMSYWDKELKELINELPDDWEIFKLVSGFEENFIYLKKFLNLDISDKFKNQKIVKRNRNNSSAVCYAINRKGMRKMLNLFYQKDYINLIYKINMIDREIFNNFIVYETKKNLFLLDSFELESTIYNRNLYWDSLQILKSYDI
tara:strand:- start:5978 stop:6862 length:885 start_codon:yes stop_codon:yes gene_type:complete